MTIVFHDRPLVVIHAAGWPLCEPTETNPCAVAATASTWLEPVARFTSCARVQLVMRADHQTSATQPPPGATSRPTMTYPAGPAVAATAETPARARAMWPPPPPPPHRAAARGAPPGPGGARGRPAGRAGLRLGEGAGVGTAGAQPDGGHRGPGPGGGAPPPRRVAVGAAARDLPSARHGGA